MKKTNPKFLSISELSKLDEYSSTVDWIAGQNSMGENVIMSRYKPLYPLDIDGIVFFSDKDGCWTTVQDEDGSWKKKKIV